MNVQRPSVGPIIGYTTSNEVRIWLRGKLQKTDDEGYNRCFGVVQLKGPKDKDWVQAPRFVKMPPHFDMTGVCVFTGLLPETDYEYRAGWFYAETEMDNLGPNLKLDWEGISPKPFRTGTAKKTAGRSYAIGSCRYLLRLFGGSFFDDRGDKAFRSILEQIEDPKSPRPVDGLLMVGDQVYADDLNFVGPDTQVDEYLKRYREVFSQPHLARLMSRVPTYMVLDDHEIEDNWPAKATDKDRHTLYPAAMHAYQIYQCSHGPVFPLGSDGSIEGTLSRFWYTFEDGCCDWFVLDCRTERVWDTDPSRRKMVKDDQLRALLKWLDDGSGAAKMIVSSVPFFPDLESDNDDKWGGFPWERTQILDFIVSRKIRKVAFVSGDVHCSFVSELTCTSDPSFKVHSIVSSSFFWPYPHMEASDFVLKGELRTASSPKATTANKYQVSYTSKVHSTDNFCRLEVDPAGFQVTYYERKGAPLGKPVVRQW